MKHRFLPILYGFLFIPITFADPLRLRVQEIMIPGITPEELAETFAIKQPGIMMMITSDQKDNLIKHAAQWDAAEETLFPGLYPQLNYPLQVQNIRITHHPVLNEAVGNQSVVINLEEREIGTRVRTLVTHDPKIKQTTYHIEVERSRENRTNQSKPLKFSAIDPGFAEATGAGSFTLTEEESGTFLLPVYFEGDAETARLPFIAMFFISVL